MEIRKITLENIKSYQSATVELRNGTTAISGHNGAGKSTLIEAIGLALFDYRPYAYNKFLREGEKNGNITVEFLSAYDERPYQAHRKITASASPWQIYDPEIRNAVAQGKEDVTDFLRLHLGIDKNIDLVTLFSSAIAVPQGTFTADFLQNPSRRKQIFDPLLQVDEYRKAFENLLPVTAEFRDQLTRVSQSILEKQGLNANLPQWEAALQEKNNELLHLLQQTQTVQDQREQLMSLIAAYAAQQQHIEQLRSELAQAQKAWEHQQQRSLQAEEEAARTAKSLAECLRAEAAHAEYVQAEEALITARKREQQLQSLQQAIALQEKHIGHLEERIQALQTSLSEALQAASEVERLQPKVAEYQHANELVRLSRQAQHEIELLQKRRKAASTSYLNLKKQFELKETALQERSALLQQTENEPILQARYEELRKQQLIIESARTQLPKKEKLIQSLQKQARQFQQLSQEMIDRLQMIRALGDTKEALQTAEQEYQESHRQLAEMQAQLAISERSMHEALGGFCPILRESCINISQKHAAGLDEYLGEQIAQLTDQITLAAKESKLAEQNVSVCRENTAKSAEMPTLEQRLSELQEQLHLRADEQTTAEAELAEIRQSIASATENATAIAACASQLETARAAQKRLTELRIYEEQLQHDQENLAAFEHELQEIEQSLVKQSPVAAALSEREQQEQQLKRIADHVQSLQVAAATENRVRNDLSESIAAQQTALQELHALQADALQVAGAHAEVARLDAIVQKTRMDHQTYLRNEGDAQRAEGTAQMAAQERVKATALHKQLTGQQSKYLAESSAFPEEHMRQSQQELQQLEQHVAMLRENIIGVQKDIEHIELQVQNARQREAEIQRLVQQKQEIEKTQEYFTFCRATIRDAGPRVTKALLTRISAEANAIFADIMGTRMLSLSWNEEYDITVRSGPAERSFAQLSGGEQMTAALAVRLALLRALTNSRLAIFDEPTQNMDLERRMNLAEQIRRIRDFSQIIVISHDDTFEDGLDAVVRVEKRNGATIVTGGLRAFA